MYVIIQRNKTDKKEREKEYYNSNIYGIIKKRKSA